MTFYCCAVAAKVKIKFSRLRSACKTYAGLILSLIKALPIQRSGHNYPGKPERVLETYTAARFTVLAGSCGLPAECKPGIISERRTARGCPQQGVRFDPDMPQTIRLEFAKSNTKVSKPKPAVATAAPAAHPALMHPLTGRKYCRRTPARRALDRTRHCPPTT